MSKIVAAALLFASSALAQCNAGVERFAGECSCNSGYIGPVCDDNAGSLCNFPNAAPLRTEAVAELDAAASGVSENTLNLRIKGFPATDRYFSRMDVNSDNENCRYPGPNAVKSFEPCTDIFDIGIPIPELINNCSFAVDPEGAFTTLTGDIIVAAVDQLGEFRGTPIVRETKSALSFSVSLPNTVTVNSSALQVFSEIEIMAAVVLQEFERSNDLVSVELFTSVQFPYTLSPVNIVPPAGLEDYLTWEPMVPCVNTNGAPCEQNLAFNLVNLTAASICDFSGIYTINVTYYCQEVDDCPVEGAPVASIELDLNSGNICEGNVVINGELDGSLTSYGNPEHSGEEKIIFTAGETVYMLLELTSSIEIESIDLDVVVVVDGEEINISSNPQLYGYNEVELNPGEKGFYFVASYGDKVANPDLLFDLDEQQATPFYVTANVLVTYKTSFGRKRDISQSSFSLSAQSILLH